MKCKEVVEKKGSNRTAADRITLECDDTCTGSQLRNRGKQTTKTIVNAEPSAEAHVPPTQSSTTEGSVRPTAVRDKNGQAVIPWHSTLLALLTALTGVGVIVYMVYSSVTGAK